MMVRELAIDTVRRWRRDVAEATPETATTVWDRIEDEVAEILYDLEETQEMVRSGDGEGSLYLLRLPDTAPFQDVPGPPRPGPATPRT